MMPILSSRAHHGRTGKMNIVAGAIWEVIRSWLRSVAGPRAA
jgi:hypothetical protein